MPESSASCGSTTVPTCTDRTEVAPKITPSAKARDAKRRVGARYPASTLRGQCLGAVQEHRCSMSAWCREVEVLATDVLGQREDQPISLRRGAAGPRHRKRDRYLVWQEHSLGARRLLLGGRTGRPVGPRVVRQRLSVQQDASLSNSRTRPVPPSGGPGRRGRCHGWQLPALLAPRDRPIDLPPPRRSHPRVGRRGPCPPLLPRASRGHWNRSRRGTLVSAAARRLRRTKAGAIGLGPARQRVGVGGSSVGLSAHQRPASPEQR
jgi:hypothetical protein